MLATVLAGLAMVGVVAYLVVRGGSGTAEEATKEVLADRDAA
jgi:ABC-type transporter Mla subunit MlaD